MVGQLTGGAVWRKLFKFSWFSAEVASHGGSIHVSWSFWHFAAAFFGRICHAWHAAIAGVFPSRDARAAYADSFPIAETQLGTLGVDVAGIETLAASAMERISRRESLPAAGKAGEMEQRQ